MSPRTKTLYEWFNQERAALAKELHDGMSQDLIGINFKLARVLRHLEKGTATVPQITEQVRDLTENFNALFIEVRRLSERLHPQLLDSFGLTAAVESELREFSARTGVDTELKARGDFNKPGARHSVDLFRISQDIMGSLSGSFKPDSVHVSLGSDAGTSEVMQYEVLGKTPELFEKEVTAHPLFASSKERIRELGGEIHFEKSDAALSICVELPLVT